MQSYPEATEELLMADSGLSSFIGTILIVVLVTLIVAALCYFILATYVPQNVTRTSMKIVPYNASTIAVTSMVGDPIRVNILTIVVGSNTYNASGIVDTNNNGMWDPGETILIYGQDLTKQSSIVVCAGSAVLMTSTVQSVSGGSAPNDNSSSANFTLYKQGLIMTTYSQPRYENPISSKIMENITYCSHDAMLMGYKTNDPAWPYSEAGKDRNFSVKYEGYIYIDQTAQYSLRLIVTDSAYIRIDGYSALDIAGEHAPYIADHEINLTKGYHTLEIGYENFNNNTPMIQFQYNGPWGYYKPVESIYYPDTENA